MPNINRAFRLPVILFLSVGIFLSCATVPRIGFAGRRFITAPSLPHFSPVWQPFFVHGNAEFSTGIGYCAGKLSSPYIEFHALRIDLSASDLRLVVRGGAPKRADSSGAVSTRVSSFVRDNGLIAGINALPFDPVSGREGEPRINIGLVVSDGVMVSPPHPGYDALVVYDNGVMALVSQSAIESVAGIVNAAGGFHQILQDGDLTGRTLRVTARHPRSAAGISAEGRFLYLLAIDGRRLGSIGSTEAETARVLKALGAHNGINFDGGGSTALVLRLPNGKIRAANVPIHRGIPGRERAVAGCVGIAFTVSEAEP